MQVRQLEELRRAWESKLGRKLTHGRGAVAQWVSIQPEQAKVREGACVSTKDELPVVF